MKSNSLRRKAAFPFLFLFAEMVFAGFSLPAHSTPGAHIESARQQINALLIKQAGATLDALAAQKQWPEHDYQLNVFMPASVASLTLCSTPPVINAPHPQTSLRQFNYEVVCKGTTPWQVKASVKPDVYVPVLMPARTLERGEAISADDLILKKFNISNQRGELLFNADDAVGLSARRTLGAYKPITLAQLQQPLLIKRDEAVTIVSQSGGISASTAGVALKNGYKGEVIKVQNANSQRVISAAVTDSGVVKALTAAE